MGKRTRKTRWRTLPIGDERSDSEESNSTLDTRIHPTYHQKYNSRLTYSSQSTPTRRYQSDSNKSTRSSSTTSENKITFNEDEYTRITTPRQDVLFKKGYLNKPKTYSTQTSTGNSNSSTGNSTTSTGNGTPDYQSTDLEYESHFVFPNGFMDQSGIYYVNGYDPYPLVVYNAPPYYSNETCNRAKKYTTESSTETAITNEENSQEVANHSVEIPGDGVQHTAPPQVNGNLHQSSHIAPPVEYSQVYNVVYPGFYYESCAPPQELVNGQVHQSEPKRIKRRRRRKLSSTKVDEKQIEDTTSEYSEDDVSSANEEEPNSHDPVQENQTNQDLPTAASTLLPNNSNEILETENPSTTPHSTSESRKETKTDSTVPLLSDQVNVDTKECDTNGHQNENLELQTDCTDQPLQNSTAQDSSNSDEKKLKYDLKPDAQEFIPRCMRPESVQFFKIPPNFVPVPMLNPMGAQNYNHPYLPVNFIQQGGQIYPGFVPGFVPPNFNPVEAHHALHLVPNGDPYHSNHHTEIYSSHEVNNKSDVDIRTVVSKLEEVANEPSKSESLQERRNKNSPNISPSKRTSFKHYDERKKYQQKNNRLNGFFHKKPYNKYQNNGSTFNSNHCEGETDELEECSKPETPKVHVNDTTKSLQTTEKEDGEPTSEMKQSLTCQSSIQNSSSDKENKIKPQNVDIEVLSNTVTSIEENINDRAEECSTRVEIICSSSKFQVRSTNEKPQNAPKALINKNDNNIASKRRFTQRDENNQLKWPPKVQPEEKIYNNFNQNDINTNKFNKKIHPDSPAKRLNNQNVSQSTYNSNVKKFSDTVKKWPLSSPKNSATKENTQKRDQEIKPELSEVNNTLISKTQWISVSNKKKRRNRNMEETDESFDSLIIPQDKEPEKFEQNAFLQNIIVNSNLNNVDTQENAPLAEKVVEHLPEIIRTSPVRILEVRELEKELLSNVGIVIKEEESVEIDEKDQPMPKSKSTSKKKSKKSNQKQVTKRIIITDADLSGNRSETKNDDISAELHKNLQEIAIVEEAQEQIGEVAPEEVETNEIKTESISTTKKEIVPNENPEKKNKKKKKKQSKVVEISSSNTTLNSCEDTYDLLLENTFSSNSDEKTNMEISQELDLIIQRGMYNNLEEKIKSLNIIPIREEFFQSVVQNSRESSTEKTPEFSKFLSNSMPKFKYCMATMGDDALKVPLTHFDQPSTSKDLFVENLEVNELLKDIYGTDEIPTTEMKEVLKMPSPPRDMNIERKNDNSAVKQVDSRESSVPKTELDTEKLYPITLAVKKWMTKTRENTPEVEILKSPSVIFKEFCEKPDLENKKRNSGTFESDEEVTVYSLSRNNSGAVDLLDCWENEISSSDFEEKSSVEVSCDNESNKANDSKEEEVLLEIYESKYGQNEDFIELQKEIEEKKRQENDSRSRNFPKHGALPYRAICCNVM